jgi:hypothetical protein
VEKLGLILSETAVLGLIIWSAIALVRYRRCRRNQPPFSDRDRQLLFGSIPGSLQSPVFRLRLARAILASTAATWVLFVVLAPFGAAIVSVALILTGAGIVRWLLMVES